MRPRAVPISFADLELQRQCLDVDVVLQQIGQVLDQQRDLIALVRQDLLRDLRKPHTGRAGLTAEQTLRAYVLKQVKAWDLRELRDRTADGLTLRVFTHFFAAPVPKHKAFHRAFCRLQPQTVRAINDRVVRWAVAQGLEDGKKLRSDTTVVETNIHYPTDSTLLWDGVRVLSRLADQIRALLPGLTAPFVDHRRRARRRMQELQRLTPTQRQAHQVPKYRDLITVTEAVIAAARAVATEAKTTPGPDVLTGATVAAAIREISTYSELTERAVGQARRRVLQHETVPNENKIFSLFEPHTDLIKRGKARKPVEFGHKVLLSESGHGLITDYRVLDGNPGDDGHVASILQQHLETFGTAPELGAFDRGFHSAGARGMPSRGDEDRVPAAARRAQDAGARGAREESEVSAGPTLPRGDRGADLRADAGAGDEAVSGARP